MNYSLFIEGHCETKLIIYERAQIFIGGGKGNRRNQLYMKREI